MKKKKRGRKLSREKDQRNALLKSLAASLVLKEKIKTTEAKAKELSGFVEKQITKAKRGSIHTRRMLSKLFPQKIVKIFVDDIGPRYKDRKGGYTRIIKLGQRKINGAKMAIIELIK